VRLLINFKAATHWGDLEVNQSLLAVDRTRLGKGTARKDEIMPQYEALYLMPEKGIVIG